ncbi:MAG: hypothetical protein ABR529_15445 [Actinomycetota bacterium]
MAGNDAPRRRSLKYIRLAAYLAGQPPESEELRMSLEEIEEVVDDRLPDGARFPSWWRNDDGRAHSRAWLLAGWKVVELGPDATVVFARDRAEGSR